MEPGARIYCDTCALVKMYFEEDRSAGFEDFFRENRPLFISSLTVLEMRSTLAKIRRKSKGRFSRVAELTTFNEFQHDIRVGNLRILPVKDEFLFSAADLVNLVHPHTLYALDSLHLAIAEAAGISVLASADKELIRSAGSRGFEVIRFD